ncbi:MAG: arylsulfatase [Actinomycetota bacterium]|nr:arylsulfatase [Actinomycetota bacterium]MEC8119819.1 arylsulfatase [Actinomycetota bacterium]MEC8392007.1 arylsulfatase [Actinomycetota bacterium]MEC9210183.1 arylsulfatase [Actinomycetota bacterium]
MAQLRKQESSFKGTIGKTLNDSEPWFELPQHPGEDAPNVVVVLLDDTGFAQLGCYGSSIDTENIDNLAADGMQFTNFHVTPLCSPTRASLLTGRSQHAVGMRSVSNFRTGFPHMLGHITNEAATMAEIFQAEGYATFCAGKWHLAPMENCSSAGPFDQWPLGRGFDRFYGFLEGETDQFHPDLVRDNHSVQPPGKPEDGYHLSEDLVDNLLRMIADSKGVRPDRPFFAYLPFGATHAPHQAPPDYLKKYRGLFDEGWDVIRESWHQRQLELGVIPSGTQLAPRNPGVENWDNLPQNQKLLAARLQEAFAAFLDHTDDQIGRLVSGLRDADELDNTIFILLSDNGASQEGGPFGVMHEMKFFNGILETPDQAIQNIDDIGGPHSHTNYPWGWAQAGNTPFKWYKQNTHEGGVHVPLIIHWPKGIEKKNRGSLLNQFVNVSDIAPTLFEILNIQAPETYKGVPQIPISGHSFAHLLADPKGVSNNMIQYFENSGSRALIAGEWKAVCRHQTGADYETEQWELYKLTDDWSECNDLAESEPKKLTELQNLWWEEAEKHGVLPLDDRGFELFRARFRDLSPHPTSRKYVYRPPMSPIPGQASAAIGGRSFDLTATITRQKNDQGVLFSTGTENSGISIFIQNERFVVDYNAFDDHSVVRSNIEIPIGYSTLRAQFRRLKRGGEITIYVNEEPSGSIEIPLFMRMISSVGSSIGYDHGSAVSPQYESPFPFSGELHQIEIQLAARRASDADQAQARAENARQ